MGVIDDLVNGAEDVTQEYLNAVTAEYRALMKAGKLVASPIASFGSDVVTARKPPDSIIRSYEKRGFNYLDTYDVSSVCGVAALGGATITSVGLAIPTVGTSELLLPVAETFLTGACDGVVNIIESVSPERNLNCDNIVVATFVNWNAERVDFVPFCESWFN